MNEMEQIMMDLGGGVCFGWGGFGVGKGGGSEG